MTPELIAAIVACLGALTAYLKSHSENAAIKKDREQTRSARDAEQALLNYRVEQLEKGQGTLTETISKLQESVNKLQISVAELVAELRSKDNN